VSIEHRVQPARAAYLAIWHDTQEPRTGDLPHTVKGFRIDSALKSLVTDTAKRIAEAAMTISPLAWRDR
jgi:putative hydrolase of HD superfamily